MNTYPLNIASPEGSLFKGNAVDLSLRGTEGDLAVLAGHVPFVTAVRECDCKITLEDGSVREAHTSGGLLTVGKEETIFLSSGFVWKEE
ncbi:MAG: F0F1 ATP synthase subunit epsilon [Lachnospiraceae bacterium]|nr:F0F1 ATP synthase subunit epsilon [Lachnospiraceae bacterium]